MERYNKNYSKMFSFHCVDKARQEIIMKMCAILQKEQKHTENVYITSDNFFKKYQQFGSRDC